MAEHIRSIRNLYVVGDLVEVTGIGLKVRGQVIVATTPDKMPQLGPESEQAMELVPEWGTDFVLVVRSAGAKPLLVLHHPGGWRDCHGQDLSIVAVVGAG